jgi:hypothetical protein
LASGLLVLATLAAGHEIVQSAPDRSVTMAHILRTGDVGDRVESLTVAATVVSVRGGSAVLTERHEEYHTDGVWLVVRVRLESLHEPNQITLLAIRDRRGRTFDATERFFQSTVGYTVQPAIPVEMDVVFEVPRDAVPDSHLRVNDEKGLDVKNHTVADVDLGLDERSLQGFLANDGPVQVEAMEVKV